MLFFLQLSGPFASLASFMPHGKQKQLLVQKKIVMSNAFKRFEFYTSFWAQKCDAPLKQVTPLVFSSLFQYVWITKLKVMFVKHWMKYKALIWCRNSFQWMSVEFCSWNRTGPSKRSCEKLSASLPLLNLLFVCFFLTPWLVIILVLCSPKNFFSYFLLCSGKIVKRI